MINETSLRAVGAARRDENGGRPLYGSYCFSEIPHTVCRLLTGDGERGLPDDTLPAPANRRIDTVILILVDAFGWRFFERYAERYPFLQRFVERGVVSPLTTQFPSTTAVHVTSVHTGLTPAESGVYEWFTYDPHIDRIIAPLLFSFAGDRERNTLRPTGVPAETLFRWQTVYQRLARQGVRSTLFQHRDYTPSPYSNVLFAGAEVRPYRTLSEALVNLAEAATSGKGYFFLYLDPIDTIGHVYGPNARAFDAEVDTVMTMLERLLHGNLAGGLKNALLLVTADHGQIEVAPEATIFLNRTLPALEPMLRRNRQGELLVPAGSPRDLFLHVREERRDEAHALLSAHLEGRAEVRRVPDLIEAGFFGSDAPSPAFLSRVGDLVVLPHRYETVWWYERGRFDMRFRGMHGGLTREEMETVLLALPYE